MPDWLTLSLIGVAAAALIVWEVRQQRAEAKRDEVAAVRWLAQRDCHLDPEQMLWQWEDDHCFPLGRARNARQAKELALSKGIR